MLIPMQTYVNDLKKQVDDLEWQGKFTEADRVKYILSFAEEDLKRGQLYEPNF